MKKQLVIIGIIAILVSVGLSGCSTQNNNFSNNSNTYDESVELSNVTVYTKWGTTGNYSAGFHHDINTSLSLRYFVTGSVKNIADKPIKEIQLKATFTNDSGNVITTRLAFVVGLNMGESKPFSFSIYQKSETYFDSITDYEVEITSVVFS